MRVASIRSKGNTRSECVLSGQAECVCDRCAECDQSIIWYASLNLALIIIALGHNL
jgi:hypothetical protein